ncbi:MAG: glycosyltransferase [Eubacterium sp.]|nr:glycosyltransferase [Eubacterium sp.]
MYHIEQHVQEHDTPWNTNISERVKKLFDAKKAGLKTVVYLYEAADTSTFRYRVYNMCQILELSLSWRGTYFFKNELEMIYKYIHMIDFVIIVRFRWDSKIGSVLDFIHDKGLKAAFDTDDLVYNTKYIPMIMNTLSVYESQERLDYWFSYVSRMEYVISKCDCMITTNLYLADLMKKDLNKNAYIAKNCLNRIQLDISQDYYQQKMSQHSIGRFVVGYFSGTPSHINDFRIAAPELLCALSECPEMVLRIVGFLELPAYMKELQSMGKIEYEPLVPFTELQKKIAEADVNIAPLADNKFTNCKSELKFFEAAAVGTVTCASPVFVFSRIIEDQKNGYLCRQGQWADTLKRLYHARGRGTKALCERAYQTSMEQYAYYNLVKEMNRMLDDISEGNQ